MQIIIDSQTYEIIETPLEFGILWGEESTLTVGGTALAVDITGEFVLLRESLNWSYNRSYWVLSSFHPPV